MHTQMEVQAFNQVAPINGDFLRDLNMDKKKMSFFKHSGDSCNNHIALITTGKASGDANLSHRLAECLPGLTRQSICHFNVGDDLEQIQSCLASHKHVIIANCQDDYLENEPVKQALPFNNYSVEQLSDSVKPLVMMELKEPYLMRQPENNKTAAGRNALIADELAYISLNRELPRTWLFIVNPGASDKAMSDYKLKSNAFLGCRNHTAGGYCQELSPSLEAALPSLTLKLQTMINDLLEKRN